MILLFNEGSLSGLAELYHEDAINYQIPNEPVAVKDAIKSIFPIRTDDGNKWIYTLGNNMEDEKVHPLV